MSKFVQKIIFTCISLFLTGSAFAQVGSIAGKVVDAKTGEELIGVSVLVEGTAFGAATDFQGKFIINNLKPGSYNLSVSYIAYKKKSVASIEVKAKEVTNVNITLEGQTKDLAEVNIRTQVRKESSVGLLIQQKNERIRNEKNKERNSGNFL